MENVHLLYLGFLISLLFVCTCQTKVSLNVDFEKVFQVVNDRFVGVTLDSTLIKDGWLNFDFKSVKLINLARGIAPCYLRIGGTSADRLIFDPDRIGINKPWTKLQVEQEFIKKDLGNFTMSSTDWDLINKFTSSVGWDIIFDLNVLLRKDGHWDPANTELLLSYTLSRGYKLAGFQLGNEPDLFPHVFDMRVKASALAQDFVRLQKVQHSYLQFHDSLIIGPDVTRVIKPDAKNYFEEFLATGGGKVVNKTSFHHYYVNGRTARVEDFLDPSILDTLKKEITDAVNITNTYCHNCPVWLGETGSAYGGGAVGLSDAYVAGFMWLDKLGMSARYGIKAVLRQSFYKGNYAMLTQDTLDPLPDYWLTVLYKRLVGGRVLSVMSNVSTDSVRVYAHCTNTKSIYNYEAGSLTLYAMNLKHHDILLSLPQFLGKMIHVFWLTPGKRHDLKSNKVKLNDKTLELTNNKLPELAPVKLSSNQMNVPAHTFGFIVIPNAHVDVCNHVN